MKKLTIFIVFMVLALSLTLSATPVYAIPALPHAFYGTVEINGSPAPTGTRVEAMGEGVATGIPGNPTTTTVSGIYGTSNPFEPRLIVQGDISDGTPIAFFVNGTSTGETYPFDRGETTELDLSVTISEPSEPSPSRPPTIETSIFGIEGSFRISSTGEILETIVATSEDGMLTMTIEAGTIALLEGEPLETLTVAIEPSPPEPPEGTYLIGAYDFGPEGATFDPPITLTWSYDPEAVPEDMDCVIAYRDEVNEEWVWIPCEIDTENNIITASVAHFTTFAVIVVPVEAPPVEEEVPPVEEEEEEEEEVITVEEEEVVEEEEEEIVPPTEPITPTDKPGVNWAMIGGIIAGVIVIALLTFVLLRRREYKLVSR